MGVRWDTAFVAISALVGEPLEAALGVLGDGGANADARVARGLSSPSREARALAIARVVSEVALAVDASRLA